MWDFKKNTFNGVSNLMIVTPSKWLNDLVSKSFLRNYNSIVINNGIDLTKFKRVTSSFKETYNLTDKYIVLGVSFGWNNKKGLDIFIKLSRVLDESYQIVLVGADENVDKILPENIISLHRVDNYKELVEIYNASDVFVNPTREEVFGLVNIEALACGTPVVTFRTGGCTECLDDSCGSVIEKEDFVTLVAEITRICKEKPYAKEACINRAKLFDIHNKYREYIELYKKMGNNNENRIIQK